MSERGLLEEMRDVCAGEVRQIYSVYQGEDDRGCGGKPTWWFLEKEIAKSVAKGRGYFDGNASVGESWAVVVGDKAWLLTQFEPVTFGGPESDDDVRQKALAKLNAQERKVLGLDKILMDGCNEVTGEFPDPTAFKPPLCPDCKIPIVMFDSDEDWCPKCKKKFAGKSSK